MHLSLSFTEKEVAGHTREFAAIAADRQKTEPGIEKGARVLARLGFAALTDPGVRKRMKEALKKARKA
jgi:hypothetical protein